MDDKTICLKDWTVLYESKTTMVLFYGYAIDLDFLAGVNIYLQTLSFREESEMSSIIRNCQS